MNLPEDTLYPRNITELRRALNASRSRTDRTVYVTAFKSRTTTNTRDLQVKGPADPARSLTVVNAAGFNDYRVVSGNVHIHARSAWGNPVKVETASRTTVEVAPGTKATLSGAITAQDLSGDLARVYYPGKYPPLELTQQG